MIAGVVGTCALFQVRPGVVGVAPGLPDVSVLEG